MSAKAANPAYGSRKKAKIDTKKFKRLARRNQSKLTYGDTVSSIPATEAVANILENTTNPKNNNSDESFYDVIEAFSSSGRRHSRFKSKAESTLWSHSQSIATKNVNQQNVEKLTKRRAPKRKHKWQRKREQSLDSSSNATPSGSDESAESDESTEPTDSYRHHWSTRFADRKKDILPVLQQRSRGVMKLMDFPEWFRQKRDGVVADEHSSNWRCFIDSDCSPFAIGRSVDSPATGVHPDVATAYKSRSDRGRLSQFEAVLLSAMGSYRDVLFCGRSWKNDGTTKQCAAMHFLGHVLRTQDLQKENARKLAANELVEGDSDDNDVEGDQFEGDRFEAAVRDRGFHRTTVLVVTPHRENVRKFGCLMLENLCRARQLHNERWKLFIKEFGDGQDLAKDGWKRTRSERTDIMKAKGMDFGLTFSGNVDDDFCCGVRVGDDGVCFMQKWVDSDIVFISPLRLKMEMEGLAADGKGGDHGKRYLIG